MATSNQTGPLATFVVIERFGTGSTEIGRAAVSFAGLLARRFGAVVIREEMPESDPMRSWAPFLPDGSSALLQFLTAGKEFAAQAVEPRRGMFLLTDDAQAAKAWPFPTKLLVQTADGSPERAASELTMAAATGVLDIVADAGEVPLPLPGYQMAYAAGLAAFCAMQASILAELLHLKAEPAEVSAHEVGTWLNWKHRLTEVSGTRESGIERQEEWKVIPCKDGFVAPVFRDIDMNNLAALARSPRLADPDFKTWKGRVARIDELYGILGAEMLARTRGDIIEEADRLRLPFGPVLSPLEVLNDEQMAYRRFFAKRDGMLQPEAPVLWNGERLTA